MVEMDADALLAALGVEVEPIKAASHTPREERIIAGFEDILRFHEAHGRAPLHGEDRDIFERLYAVRLDQLRKLPEARALLAGLDMPGLLAGTPDGVSDVDALDEDALLAALGVVAGDDITVLRHVRSHAQIQAAEDMADRTSCADFDTFKPLFDEVESGLKQKRWMTKPFGKNASIERGDFFVLGGLVAYVAEVGDTYKTPNAETNGRLRVIYSNGTESDLLLRSLQRALYKDSEGRAGSRLIKVADGPLFGDAAEPDDIASGTIYVLRSLSRHPFVAEHRELIHKIGVTGGRVETRIAAAKKDATYLLADVEIVATYTLHNINRTRLESLFHRVFAAAQLELSIEDRFGHQVKPKEWFLVPLQVIDEAVERIRDGSITTVVYDPHNARLVSCSDD
ncbi:MAG: GIY-YIG nuclease family protein [Stenotrophomonas sp.]